MKTSEYKMVLISVNKTLFSDKFSCTVHPLYSLSECKCVILEMHLGKLGCYSELSNKRACLLSFFGKKHTILSTFHKVEKILKGNLDLIPSTTVEIQSLLEV